MKTDIIILSKTQALLSKALASICRHVDRKSIGKVVVGWTGEEQPAEQDVSMLGLDMTIESLGRYNFARNNNYLVDRHCASECLLFMNDDVELVEDSVTRCLGWLEGGKVGTVGIKLLYRDRTIQHAGQFVSVKNGRFAGVGHLLWKTPDAGIPPLKVVGSTGAFCMTRRADFLAVGGFNENYRHCFEDVELNLQMLRRGLVNVCDNTTWAWHDESLTRKQSFCVEDQLRLTDFVNSNIGLFAEEGAQWK